MEIVTSGKETSVTPTAGRASHSIGDTFWNELSYLDPTTPPAVLPTMCLTLRPSDLRTSSTMEMILEGSS